MGYNPTLNESHHEQVRDAQGYFTVSPRGSAQDYRASPPLMKPRDSHHDDGASHMALSQFAVVSMSLVAAERR